MNRPAMEMDFNGNMVPVRAPKPVLRIVSGASLAGTTPPPRPWHVERLIPGKTVTLMSGDGGVGKTLLALQLAAATATGSSWIGYLPEPGPVLFVTAEDDMDEIHRRLIDVAAGQGLALEDLGDLRLLSLAGKDALLAIPESRETMVATPLFEAIEDAVKSLRPVLIVLDPLADLFGGDEIKKTHARQFIGFLRGLSIRYEAATLLLSHPSQSGINSGEGTSGNVGWSNSVRSRLYFERPRREEGEPADPDARILSLKKSNYGSPSLTVALRWSSGIFVLDAGGSALTSTAADADRVFLELLEQFERDGRNVSSSPCATYAPKLFAQHPTGRGIKKAEFQNAMNRLFSANRIRTVTEGPPSKLRSRLVAIVVEPAD